MITFLSTAEKVNNNSTNVMNLDVSIPMDHVLKTFKNPFPNIKVKYTSKTDKIIIELCNLLILTVMTKSPRKS